MKKYIREGRRFVAIPDRKDYAGKWVDGDTHQLCTEKPKNPLGLCVDVEGTSLVLITDTIGPTSFTQSKDVCKSNIQQLIDWAKEIRVFAKDLIEEYGWIRIWSTTPFSFCSRGSDRSDLYCLCLDSDYCYVGDRNVDRGYRLFALKTETFPISKLSK